MIDALYLGHSGRADFVDVPKLGFVMIDSVGAPGGPAFTDALQVVYSVSYGAHFALKRAAGAADRVMTLETLWWALDLNTETAVERVAAGTAGLAEADRERWCWRALIVQLAPIAEVLVARSPTRG